MTIRVVPLGGLGEIGMNCMAIEMGASPNAPIVVVDCGVQFPNEARGIELYHPDFSYLETHRARILALLVTHGHEDHIGAIPYLLRRMELPIYAPPYALGLIRERLKEHAALPGAPRGIREPTLIATVPRRSFRLGQGPWIVEVEPIRVTHSIADATALAIRGDAGIVVHTGDFKIDPEPSDDEHFDSERLERLGREGVSLLLSDSTNSDSPGTSRTEQIVAETLETLITDAPALVVVSLFASNVHRIRALTRIARRARRRIALLGRSVQTHVRVAHETGYLSVPSEMLVSIDDIGSVPRRALLVIATGSQAEPRAALSRVALDDHPKLRLDAGDMVILSSRAIPGNDVAVMRLVGDLHRRGCRVHIASTDPGVHASGHAHRDEQRVMLDLVAPHAFVPVHGTRHHLERHAQIARESGVAEVLVVENGEIVEVDGARRSSDPSGRSGNERETLRKVGVTRAGKIAVDELHEVSDAVLRDRGLLAEVGVVAVGITVDARGRPIGEPAIASRGAFDEARHPYLLADAREEVRLSLAEHPYSSEHPEDGVICDIARMAARRALGRQLGRKPVAIAVLLHERRATGGAGEH